MTEIKRREFLKVLGLTGTSTVVGCSSESARKLIPYIVPPDDIVPGEATFFATTCRECPAGCGMLAKNREGRAIKVEGNPRHPINRGAICPRGQASLHGLYNPDRLKGPVKRQGEDSWVSVSWSTAQDFLVERLQEIVGNGRGERVVFLSGLTTGTLKDLIGQWLAGLGSRNHHMFEPFSYEALRTANRIVFGHDTLPTYHLEEADFLISFGAGFLETWLSNVEYSRRFALFHEPKGGLKPPYVYIGPRQSLTAANADLALNVPPGTEYLVGVGLIRSILDEEPGDGWSQERRRTTLRKLVEPHSMTEIVEKTGIEEKRIRKLARRFMQSERPLALAAGLAHSGAESTAAAVAANLLCRMMPGSQSLIDFGQKSSLSEAERSEHTFELIERMRAGEVDLLFLYDANPVFGLPASLHVEEALKNVPVIISFSSCLDETGRWAHWALPTHTPLESWGDYSPRNGVVGLMQPVMGPVHQTRHLGDLLISTGKKVNGEAAFPWSGFFERLQEAWRGKRPDAAPERSFERFWLEALQRGGLWQESVSSKQWKSALLSEPFAFSKKAPPGGEGFLFTVYPTIQFFDGRTANRPWMQELPDPITQVTWGGWVEIHPDTARAKGISKGDMLTLESSHGAIEVPALPIPTVPTQTLAMPIGCGHTNYGRFANGLPANPLHLFPKTSDPESGGIHHSGFRVTLRRSGAVFPLANTDGSHYQHGRHMVETMSVVEYGRALENGHRPHITMPLPEGYDRRVDFYPPHSHPDYRWCMVVDLDRCIGCGACVVACYAENNVAVVGREQVLKGREMSWLRIQRYFREENPGIDFLVMLCQHCDAAPCESVCPIFAPQHSVEGLNNQVYNRCFGTRFCSQNDPYKVRRFNWFTFTRPEPLNWQLNPDVTVRQKGVMEKCSFCIQRIVEAKIKARNEKRKVRDGDFTTACAQTCPTDALIFGNLKDGNSRVAQLIHNVRAYQVLHHLNTKPAVIYLKGLTQEI